MANVKITDLTAYTDPDSTDVLPIVDVGADVTKKVSIADLLKNAGSGTAAAPSIAFDGDNTGIYRPNANQLGIATNGTERMRIGSDGQFIFNSVSYGIRAQTGSAPGTTVQLFSGFHSATNIGTGTPCMYIHSNGNIVNTNNSYGAISDIKLKENIVDASSQWDNLKDLRVRNYNFKEGQTHTQIGLVAQEVELVCPGLVTESPDRDEEGNDLGTVTKSINYSVLYMKAVKALQEAMERIEVLEQRLTDAGIA